MKTFLPLTFFFLIFFRANAQLTPACPDPLPAILGHDCSDMCVICNFTSFSGTIHEGVYPPWWMECVNSVNQQVFAFTAGEDFATITVIPSNCVNGDGLKLIMWGNCLSSPIECNGGFPGGGNTPLSISTALNIGQNYIVWIAGFEGDGCDYQVSIDPPGAGIAPVPGDISGSITGPSVLCPGISATYTILEGQYAQGYTWTAPPGWLINGLPSPRTILGSEGTSVELTAGLTTGEARICVAAVSSCYPVGSDVCRIINVANIPPTNLPAAKICFEDAPYTLPWGDVVFNSGSYTKTLLTDLGCDSIVKQQVNIFPELKTDLGILKFCQGDFVSVCGTDYSDDGQYEVHCTSFHGCDSTIKFDIQLLAPVAQINGDSVLSCASSEVLLTAEPSPTGTFFTWKSLTGVVLSQQNQYTITAGGTYILTARLTGNGFECIKSDTITIINDFSPPSLNTSGAALTCEFDTVQVMASSNASNPIWSWTGPGSFSSGSSSPLVSTPGTYFVNVSSSGINGCVATDTVLVSEDLIVPVLNAVGGALTCSLDSVQINVNTNPPASGFIWSGPNGFASGLQNPVVTMTGTYSVTVTSSSNGCTANAVAVVSSDTIPPVGTVTGGTVTCTVPMVNLTAHSISGNLIYEWTGPNNFVSSVQNPVVSDTGIYVLTLTNSLNGCSSTASTTVLADQNPPMATASASILTCAMDTLSLLGNADQASSFSWTGPNNFVSSLQNPMVNIAGNYMLTVTGANGCTSSISVNVDQNITVPDVNVSGDTINCNQPQGQINTVSMTGIAYAWSGPGNFSSFDQNPVVSAGGNYIVTVTGANGCTNTALALVGLDVSVPALQVSAPDTLTCLLNTVNLQASITAASALQNISWTGPANFVSSVEDPAVNTQGTYTLMVTDINGCSASIQTIVNQDTMPPDISAMGGTLTCTITGINLEGGSTSSGATFTWTGNNFSSTLEDPAVTTNGTYSLLVTGINGCISEAEAIVVLDTIAPDLSVSPATTLDCNILQTTLASASQTAGAGFVWTGPNNLTANTAVTTTAIPGMYQVVVTAPNGCVSTASVSVIQDISVPDISATGDTIDCISGQANLTGNSTTTGAAFAWTGPNNFMSVDQNPVVSQQGDYILTVTGVNGCTNSASITVEANTQSPEVTISGAGTLNCNTISLDLTADISTAGASGLWTGPGNLMSGQSSVTVSTPGIYTYTVTGLNGCVSAPTATVLEDVMLPQDVIVTGGLLNCSFPSINLSGNSSTPDVLYQWTGPGNFISNLPNPAVVTPGNYTLVITNPVNQCSSTATVSVTQDPTLPIVAIMADSITCLVQSVTLNATASAGVNFAWLGPNNFNSTLEDPTVTVAGAYFVTITAANGCSASSSFTLIQNTIPPDVAATGATLNCTVPNAQLTGNSNTPGVTYVWAGPMNFTSDMPNPDVTLTGVYTLIVTAPNGCTASTSVSLSPAPGAPIISATGGTITCLTNNITLNASSDISVSWQWSGPAGFSSTLQNPNIILAGDYNVVATAANGCSASSGTSVVADNQTPGVLIPAPDKLDCITTEVGLEAVVQGSGIYTYQWTSLNGIIQSGSNMAKAQVSAAGEYEVLVTDISNGCSMTQNVSVEIDPATPAGLLLSTQDVSCFGEKDGGVVIDLVQGGIAPFVYALDNQSFTSNINYEGLQAGIHTLAVQDANGCEYQTTFEISEPPELTIDLGPDTTIQLGTAILISLAGIVNQPALVKETIISPSDLTLDSLFTPVNTLMYQISVVDENGCQVGDERIIYVDREHRIYVPNILNPNSLQYPALFIFGGPEVAEIESFQIYDRWGDRVFEQYHFQPNDASKGWTGSYGGREMNPGVFVYVARVRFIDGESMLYRGDLTLIR